MNLILYKNLHIDLLNSNLNKKNQLLNHYENFGIKEERIINSKYLINTLNDKINEYYSEFNFDLGYLFIYNTNYYQNTNSIIKLKEYLKNKNIVNFYNNNELIARFINKKIKFYKMNKYKEENTDINLFLYVENDVNKIIEKYNINKYINNFDRIKYVQNKNALLKHKNPVFILHLNFNKEREIYIDNLKKYFENIYLVDAISYKEDNLINFTNDIRYRMYNNPELNEINKYTIFSNGLIALMLSFLLILNFSLKNNFENIIFFEDDVILNKDILELNNINLDLDCDILKLGTSQVDKNYIFDEINEYIMKTNKYSCGGFAVLYKNIKKMYNKIIKFNESSDTYFYDNLNILQTKKNYFICDLSLESNLRGSESSEEFLGWNINDYDYLKYNNYKVKTFFKCGSCIQIKMFNWLAKQKHINFYENHIIENYNVNVLKPYIITQRFPHNFENNIFNIFIIRHPIDRLISQYYSFGYTHSDDYLKDFKDKEYREKRRKAYLKQVNYIKNSTLDNYILDNLNEYMEEYNYIYTLKDKKNVIVLPYELMVFNFKKFSEIICELFNFDSEIFYNQFKSEFEDFEDKSNLIVNNKSKSHKRAKIFKEYLKKLKKETIEIINKKNKKVLDDYNVILEKYNL